MKRNLLCLRETESTTATYKVPKEADYQKGKIVMVQFLIYTKTFLLTSGAQSHCKLLSASMKHWDSYNANGGAHKQKGNGIK